MTTRRYTIEASIKTLARFTKIAADSPTADSFVQRLTVSSGDEYYYVVLIATEEIHKKLHADRFTNSYAVAERA
jgi:hypothetical protein